MKVGAVDVAHGQIELAVELAGCIDRDHVRVIERRRQLCLAFEALAEARVGGAVVGDQFDRHRAVQTLVGRQIDDAHAATADQALDAPIAEIAARGELPHACESDASRNPYKSGRVLLVSTACFESTSPSPWGASLWSRLWLPAASRRSSSAAAGSGSSRFPAKPPARST